MSQGKKPGGNGGGGVNNLVGPGGQPLIKEHRLIVIKLPKGVQLHPQLLAQMSKSSGCDVITLPMDSEIMMGKLAVEELESVHKGIHAILGVPE